MKQTALKLLRVYLLGDVGVVVLSLFMGGDWLLNSQLAFVCSLIITFASFYSYQKMVQNSLDTGDIPKDRFEHLYHEEDDDRDDEEDEQSPEEHTKAPSNIKISFKNFARSYKSAFSLYRMMGYGFLFLVVLFLIRHNALDAIAFFTGLSLVPLSSFMGAVMGKKGENETNK